MYLEPAGSFATKPQNRRVDFTYGKQRLGEKRSSCYND
jgi:hypothetical protein